jgi:hypothetical protein
VTVPESATSTTFTATLLPVANAQSVTLTASSGTVSETFTLELAAATPTLNVASSASPSIYGDQVFFTATISTGPTGTVTFYDGTVSLGTASIAGTTATLASNSLIAGTHSITAAWLGNISYGAVVSSPILEVVNPAMPTVSWANPAAITYGTALSAAQLDASSTVAGTFVYSPAAGSVLAAGSHTITATFAPIDSTDYTAATATATMNVNQATPVITWNASAPINYGTPLSSSELDASSTVPGAFSYSPPAGTVLKAGTQTLSVTLTPTDSTDYTTATATVPLTVNPVTQTTPTINWAAPAAITYGSALSASQLDATSSVAGTFTYSPAAGAVLKAGVQILSVTFTPTDSIDYSTASATVPLTVNPASPAITWPTPAAITYGTALSATQLGATSTVAGSFAYSPGAGTVLKAGTQTLSVAFTPTDTTDYTTATASVPLTVSQATPVITWAAPASIPDGTALSSTQLDATSTVAGTFNYLPAAGTVLTTGSHTITTTFTPTDTTDYTTASASVPLAVSQAAPSITWPAPAAITYGTALSAAQLDATSSLPGTFTYSPVAGTVLQAGTQTLSVTFTPTDTTDYTTATAMVPFTVNQATPAITWATPAAITYGTAVSATQLNATSTVAGAFAFAPASGTVLKSGAQTLSVTFTPTDTTDYTTATSTVPLTVNQATPSITWATPAAITYGTALSATQLDASSTVAGTFAYTPAAGTVLSTGVQTLAVTFTPTDTTDYKSASAAVSLTVSSAAETITWPAPAAITYGTALSAAQLNATSTVAGTFVYSPSGGTVLTAGVHTLNVTFTPTDSTDYTTQTASVTLTVNQATPAITWAAPASISYGAALGPTQLNASSVVAGTFVYTPAAGTVPKAGAQTLSVTFTPSDTTDYTTATATVPLTVTQASPTITWATPAAITYGTALSTTQLNASSTVAGTFAYNPAPGTVPKAGTQTLSVTFTPTDTTDYSTATATVSLTVNQATPTITWATPASISSGTALSTTQLDATASVPGTFVYSPVAGTILAAGGHTLTTTFTPTDSTNYATATATVTLTVTSTTQTTPTITWATPAAITYGTTLSATQLDAAASVAGTFAYSPAAGAVLTAGAHTLVVTFTPTDTTDYTTAAASVTLTVNQGTPAITWATPAAIGYGTALSATQLDATSTVAGTFSYSPSAGAVLTAGSHTITATFTPTDSTDYTTASATVTQTVNQATPAITWTTPAAIAYGTALGSTQLDASSTIAGTFNYSPAAGTVLTAGSHVITATFTPTDSTDYKPATATVTLAVNQGTPAITWTTPAAIAYGTALSATQLDATSTVAGTFSYSPTAGTVLTAGSQLITATFTPTDTADYSTATATVTLTVNRTTPAITWGTPAAINYGTALGATQLDATSTVAGSFSYSPAAGTVLTAGSHLITATFTPTDSTDYNSATATVTVTVNQATPAITWATPAAIAYGTALSATQLDASSTVAGTLSYTPAAGTVPKAGAQTLSVTFTPTDTTDYITAVASVTLTVNQATPAITWTTPAAISYGTALGATQLDASSTVAGAFNYSPSAGTVLTAGSHTITATFTPTDSADYTTATANVTLTVNQATPTITWATPAAVAYGTALSATQLDASTTVAGSFSYSPVGGTVLTAGSHTITATFTPTDATDYKGATATVTLTVNQATPPITWATPAAISYGTALSATQLDATSTVAGTFGYSPTSGTVLTAGGHTITATFTPTDTTDYTSATANVTLTVNQTTPTITWATPAAITYGTALGSTQLDASSTVAGSFSYSPVAGTVLTAGGHTITATFTPTDTTDYKTATATVTVTVNQATPVITWATPAAITSGTALSSTQLDASSTVAGSFAYSPAAGTVLGVGSQTLSVTFNPTDTTDYTAATASVTLTVNLGTPTLTINATSIGFGNVALSQPSTQTVTLTSTGTGSVTVNSAVISGTGFSLSGPTLPETLTPGQFATLDVEFDPTALGAASGTLTVTSTSSTNGTAVITLTGTGVATAYAVDLSWDAPSSSPDPVAGYNVYKELSGSSNYQLVGSTVGVGATSITDSNVQDGQVYDYIVESVDASGVESAPTTPVPVTIP